MHAPQQRSRARARPKHDWSKLAAEVQSSNRRAGLGKRQNTIPSDVESRFLPSSESSASGSRGRYSRRLSVGSTVHDDSASAFTADTATTVTSYDTYDANPAKRRGMHRRTDLKVKIPGTPRRPQQDSKGRTPRHSPPPSKRRERRHRRTDTPPARDHRERGRRRRRDSPKPRCSRREQLAGTKEPHTPMGLPTDDRPGGTPLPPSHSAMRSLSRSPSSAPSSSPSPPPGPHLEDTPRPPQRPDSYFSSSSSSYDSASDDGTSVSEAGGRRADTPMSPRVNTPRADTPRADTPRADTPRADTPVAMDNPATRQLSPMGGSIRSGVSRASSRRRVPTPPGSTVRTITPRGPRTASPTSVSRPTASRPLPSPPPQPPVAKPVPVAPTAPPPAPHTAPSLVAPSTPAGTPTSGTGMPPSPVGTVIQSSAPRARIVKPQQSPSSRFTLRDIRATRSMVPPVLPTTPKAPHPDRSPSSSPTGSPRPPVPEHVIRRAAKFLRKGEGQGPSKKLSPTRKDGLHIPQLSPAVVVNRMKHAPGGKVVRPGASLPPEAHSPPTSPPAGSNVVRRRQVTLVSTRGDVAVANSQAAAREFMSNKVTSVTLEQQAALLKAQLAQVQRLQSLLTSQVAVATGATNTGLPLSPTSYATMYAKQQAALMASTPPTSPPTDSDKARYEEAATHVHMRKVHRRMRQEAHAARVSTGEVASVSSASLGSVDSETRGRVRASAELAAAAAAATLVAGKKQQRRRRRRRGEGGRRSTSHKPQRRQSKFTVVKMGAENAGGKSTASPTRASRRSTSHEPNPRPGRRLALDCGPTSVPFNQKTGLMEKVVPDVPDHATVDTSSKPAKSRRSSHRRRGESKKRESEKSKKGDSRRRSHKSPHRSSRHRKDAEGRSRRKKESPRPERRHRRQRDLEASMLLATKFANSPASALS